MYMEDVEWCVRARRLGWEILYLPGVSVTHLFGSSQSEHSTRWIGALSAFLRAEHPRWALRLLAAIAAVGYAWRAAISAVVSLGGNPRATVRRSRLWAYATGFAAVATGRAKSA
jgi:GT2 family glycosyltransferase